VKKLAASALVLVACSSSSSPSTPPAPSPDGGAADAGLQPTSDAGDAAAAPAKYMPPGYTEVPFLSEAPERRFLRADKVIAPGKDYIAVVDTSVGRLVLDLYEAETPTTVNSFVFLALHHFYEKVAFHRVIDDFMAQTGDPKSIDQDPATWGTGGPGYKFGVELKAELKFDGPGVLGMARGEPLDSNGSQFFITLKARPDLDQQYTVWGKLTEGADLLPKIVRGEPPADPTRILEVRIGVR
jgi:peptidylprolyl isomerase